MTAASEQAANSGASTVGSLQVAEVADSSVVSQVYANCSEGEDLQQLPSMVGTIGQARNTQLGSMHTVAATSENLVSLSARSWQVAKVADNDAVSHIDKLQQRERSTTTTQHSWHH